MTETQWLACGDPIDMLLVPPGTAATNRKVRLFLCGCCRRVWDVMTPDDRAAVEVAERYADGLAAADELRATERRTALYRVVDDEEPEPEDRPPSHWCNMAAWGVAAGRAIVRVGDVCDAARRVAGDRSGEWEEVVQARLLRCIFGNPFRPVAFDPRWRSADAVGVARGIYDDRAFDRLPLLADALMDAGCNDDQVIGHCRGDGPHVRGCWVVDMVLGKE